MKRISFQTKLSIVFLVLSVGTLLVSNFFILRKVLLQQKEDLRLRIRDTIAIAGKTIPADKLASIAPRLESENTPVYQEIKQILTQIRDMDPLIDNVYTMVKTPKQEIWQFVVDSGDRKGVYVHPGQIFDVSGYPQMQTAFSGPSVDNEINSDRWGAWLSGYAPVLDSRGQAIAVIGLDVKADSIRQMQMLLAKGFISVLSLAIVLSLLLAWLFSRGLTQSLRSLMEGVRLVGKGDLSKKVTVKSRDELGELAGAFNKMTDDLLKAQSQLQRSYLNTIRSLAQALEAKDFYTRGHSERVTEYAMGIAAQMGLSARETELLREVCVLHDIGKIGIPENILTKNSPLTPEEWSIMKTHPEIGEAILRPIDFIRDGLEIVKQHHERPDGNGYPLGLKGSEISLLASITAVADTFDAMTTDRPYRKGLSREEAIAALRENKGSQFAAEPVDAFIRFLQKKS